MSFDQQRKELVNICKSLLEEGKTSLILGFSEGSTEKSSAPFFIRSVEEADILKWDEACTTTLAKYLLEKKDGAAIIAKPCDARAIVMYMAENQIDRNKVFIIGVECGGMKDETGKPAPGCEACSIRIPPLYDVLAKMDADGCEQNNGDVPAENRDEEKILTDKLERFKSELNKCILCYSCRQACYGCYCETCFMDRNMPNWLPSDPDISRKMVFHLGRAMHLAGRCVECGACQRACPSNVNIRYLVKDLADFCEELYGYQPGVNPGETPAMTAFDQNDREVGFIGGEHGDACCDSGK